jgi:hypothetical protein
MYKANYIIMKLHRLGFHFKQSTLVCIRSKNCNATLIVKQLLLRSIFSLEDITDIIY